MGFAKIFGTALGILVLVWALGTSVARLGRGPAVASRLLGIVVFAIVAFTYFGSLHRPPVELLLAPAVAYPLVANDRGTPLSLRVFLLGELVALVAFESLDLARWRYGIQVPSFLWVTLLGIMLLGVPSIALWVGARGKTLVA